MIAKGNKRFEAELLLKYGKLTAGERLEIFRKGVEAAFKQHLGELTFIKEESVVQLIEEWESMIWEIARNRQEKFYELGVKQGIVLLVACGRVDCVLYDSVERFEQWLVGVLGIIDELVLEGEVKSEHLLQWFQELAYEQSISRRIKQRLLEL